MSNKFLNQWNSSGRDLKILMFNTKDALFFKGKSEEECRLYPWYDLKVVGWCDRIDASIDYSGPEPKVVELIMQIASPMFADMEEEDIFIDLPKEASAWNDGKYNVYLAISYKDVKHLDTDNDSEFDPLGKG